MKQSRATLRPILFGVFFFCGIAWSFASGAPGPGGAFLAGIPVLAFFHSLFRSFRRQSG